jgi:hypothetical protein
MSQTKIFLKTYSYYPFEPASSVGVVTQLGLDDQRVGDRFPAGADIFIFATRHTGSGAHPASYRADTGGRFPRDKAVDVRS